MSGETILIVDDEESVRKSLADVMRDEGYDVVAVASGRQGIDLLSEARPALALLDIAMPEMDGIETLRRFRELRPDMPVIMITGHGSIETAVKTTKMGAYDFLIKPPELSHLTLVVKHGLEEHRLRKENESHKRNSEKRSELADERAKNMTLKDARAAFEREFIAQKLRENKGNVSKTADEIGLERSNLHRKIKALGVAVKD